MSLRWPISFAHGLRTCRGRAGLTAAELAKRAHMRLSTVEDLEAGRRTWDMKLVRRLAEALGISRCDLLRAACLTAEQARAKAAAGGAPDSRGVSTPDANPVCVGKGAGGA